MPITILLCYRRPCWAKLTRQGFKSQRLIFWPASFIHHRSQRLIIWPASISTSLQKPAVESIDQLLLSPPSQEPAVEHLTSFLQVESSTGITRFHLKYLHFHHLHYRFISFVWLQTPGSQRLMFWPASSGSNWPDCIPFPSNSSSLLSLYGKHYSVPSFKNKIFNQTA
jgi:hypothetical protein